MPEIILLTKGIDPPPIEEEGSICYNQKHLGEEKIYLLKVG